MAYLECGTCRVLLNTWVSQPYPTYNDTNVLQTSYELSVWLTKIGENKRTVK